MNVVILPTAFPNFYSEISGIFVQDQAQAMSKLDINVNVIGAVPISFKDILNKRSFNFGNVKYTQNGVAVNLFLYPSLPKMKKINDFFRDRINKFLLKRHYKEQVIDAIHVHNSTAGNAALFMYEKYKIPYIITEHSSAYVRKLISQKEIINFRKIYENARCRIAVSQAFCKILQDIFTLDFVYIPNIVSEDFFICKQNIKKIDEFTFINVANLLKNKNQKLLIEAFAKSFKNKKVKLQILGGGAELNNLQDLIVQLGVENQIFLFGRASRETVLSEMQKSNVFVLSSIYETFGVVLIEALASGLPVIATKCGGSESIITKQELGELVENDDVEDLSKAMYRVYDNFGQYDSVQITNHAKDNFSEKVIASKIKGVLRKVVKKE